VLGGVVIRVGEGGKKVEWLVREEDREKIGVGLRGRRGKS